MKWHMIYWGNHLKEEIKMYNYGYNCYTPCYSGANTCGGGCGGFAFILVLFILLAIICSCGGFGFGGNCGCGC